MTPDFAFGFAFGLFTAIIGVMVGTLIVRTRKVQS